jgi:hypothetical protein
MAEVKAVLMLVEIALEKASVLLHILGDSQLGIPWISGQRRHLNLALDHLIRRVNGLLSRMGNFSCCHIF